MSQKMTQKYVKSIYGKSHIIQVPYCNLQRTLKNEIPAGHTERAEGWAADIYFFSDAAISTGYAPFGGPRAPYDLTRKYENRAGAIMAQNLSRDDEGAALAALIDEFITEVLGND